MLSYDTNWVTSSRKYWAGHRSHRNSQSWPTCDAHCFDSL